MTQFVRKTFFLVLAAAVFGIGLGLAGPASATDGEHAIKYRKSVMKALGGHMASTAAIVTGKTANKGHLTAHVAGIAAISKMAKDLFPDGSDFGETTALEIIWEKPKEFAKAIKTLETASAGMVKVVKSGGDTKAALGALGKSCKGCHETYREKKKQ